MPPPPRLASLQAVNGELSNPSTLRLENQPPADGRAGTKAIAVADRGSCASAPAVVAAADAAARTSPVLCRAFPLSAARGRATGGLPLFITDRGYCFAASSAVEKMARMPSLPGVWVASGEGTGCDSRPIAL